MSLRNKKKFREDYARTERLFNSPLKTCTKYTEGMKEDDSVSRDMN